MSKFYLTDLTADVTGYKLALIDMRNPAAAVKTSSTTTTTAGDLIAVKAADATTELKWITKPFVADVTFTAQPIVFNHWGFEGDAAANANFAVALYEYTTSEQAVSTNYSPAPAELGTTIAHIVYVTTNTTALTVDAGNRLVIKVAVSHTGSMAANYVNMTYDGATEGLTGDTWIYLMEKARSAEAQVGPGTYPIIPGLGQGFYQNIIDNVNAGVGAQIFSLDENVQQLLDDCGFQRDNL
jgi:hypothetical protein